MLPRTISRHVGSRTTARTQALLVRFQTTVSGTKSSNNSTESTPKTPVSEESQPGSSAVQKDGSVGTRKPQQQRKYAHAYNRKLHEIVNQIKNAVNGIEGAESGSLSEAIDIFEEGATYLREIQVAEGIADDNLFSLFQPVSAKLFDLVLAENADLGAHSVESVLDMMVTQRVAHTYHFIAVQRRFLLNNEDPDSCARVLQLWLTYLSYSKQMTAAGAGRLLRGAFGIYRERNYQQADMLRLAYFALVTHCIKSGEDHDLAATMKILQVDDASRIPPSHFVTSTLIRLGLREALDEELRAFIAKVNERDAKNMDPNGQQVERQLERLTRNKNGTAVRRLYSEMQQASVQNGIAISEPTLNRVMNAFIEARCFDDALAIFAAMCGGLIAKPSPNSWELVLKALGHPSNISGLSENAKKEAVSKVETTFQAMIAAGTQANARVFGVFIGALANLDRQDLVAQYLAEYSHLPVVHMTKNNILVGLTLNKRVSEAETRMREFLKEDPSYTPSTSVMNTLLAHYVTEGNDNAVEGILDFMRTKNIEENIATATTLLNYYFKTYRERGMVPNVQELLTEVVKDTKNWDQHMVATLIDGLVKDGANMDAARGVFKYFCDNKPRFKHSNGMMTSMIRAEIEFGNVHNAEELFAWYIKNLRNETVMYNMMIRGLIQKRERLALKYYADLCAQRPFNVAPNFFTYFFLLEHFKRKSDQTRIQWVLDEIAAANLTDFGRNLPRQIRELSRDYKVAPELLEAVSKL